MLTDVAGVRVGQWTDHEAETGCTVVVLPPGTVGSGEVRGGAPATREFALLDPANLVTEIDAVVLSGGSAFGLAAGHGVMRRLEEEGRGFSTAGGVVPIVVGMSLYDLATGDSAVRPGEAEGYDAARDASDGAVELGAVGAGRGATVGKWGGPDAVEPGGLGGAAITDSDLVVAALIAVNAVGFIDTGDRGGDPGPRWMPGPDDDERFGATGTNTTIGVIVTNAVVDKAGCHALARSGHDGLARAVLPAHTAGDGDALVAAATGEVDADGAVLRVAAQRAVELAIRSLR